MIPKEHLRIGNLVDYELTTHVVKELHDKIVLHVWQDADNHFSNYERLDGIPLTQDWLLRFGFTANQDEARYEIAQEPLFCVDYWDDRWQHIWDTAYTGAEINYVHQLQNLYFALTGEELKDNG